ncbi:7-cyano-7-deazaguanine synthase QueC [bacterium]|nr:7-cyano-7-deazaguanine synthase QueC [bacterium]
MSRAIVIFSGGQDSTTCLGWAKNRYEEVKAVSYIYGQKHKIEIEQARKIAACLQIPLEVIDISFYSKMVNSALFGTGDVSGSHEDHEDLPASFVPNRNALFILLTHSLAQTYKAESIITGVCQTDYSGYPDCRQDFITIMETSLNLGSNQSIRIETPLMYLTKAETFELAKTEGVLDLVIKESFTCYNAVSLMNPWGRGCGNCPACLLRSKGYYEFITKTGD